MAFQKPIPIKSAIDLVFENQYVLPAIQREFVWKPVQITKLFDSLMKGYPIGSFLFWRVERENCQKFKFYRFLKEYHQKDNQHNPLANLKGVNEITAILDGQQRLTALYIGLRGSYAEKIKHKRQTSSNAYPQKEMYLNLLSRIEGENNELMYDFRFLTKEEAQNQKDKHWFLVNEVLRFTRLSDIRKYLKKYDLNQGTFPKECLENLFQIICKKRLIHCFLETDQDIDKVLNIFIRVNSSGTFLSRSDLLLSMATNQWNINAREVIHSLVDNLNKPEKEYTFNKDFVLKSCLVLADIGDIGYKIKNFTSKNIQKIESNWQKIADSLQLAVDLISQLGYDGKTLTTKNILIPIAYYLQKIGASENYLTRYEYAKDHRKIQQWVARAILKRTFGSSGDTILKTARKTIKNASYNTFPINELDSAFADINKPLTFSDEDIENLMNLTYNRKRTFSVLALLYPKFEFKNFDVDHIFPKSRFTKSKLLNAGVPEDQIEEFIECSDKIANLQLLESKQNQQKSNKMPLEWLKENTTVEPINDWKRRNHIKGEVPDEITGFLKFYEKRQDYMRHLLRKTIIK